MSYDYRWLLTVQLPIIIVLVVVMFAILVWANR